MLIDDDILLDAGTGIGDLALKDLRTIRHVFLTHAHLAHDPDIWLTGMKPGEEERILGQVIAAVPDKKIRMLSRGTAISV
ncbi:MAG: hypothetical protein V3R35_09305 [Woeseiaceae bacterium]